MIKRGVRANGKMLEARSLIRDEIQIENSLRHLSFYRYHYLSYYL